MKTAEAWPAVRKRKRGTTRDMMAVPDSIPSFPSAGLVEIPVPGHPFPSPLVPLPEFERWRMNLWLEPGEACLQIKEPMPPIRCVVEPPCSVCHYCKTHDRGVDYWMHP